MANLSLVFDLLAKDNASGAFNKVGDSAERAGRQGIGFGSAISNGLKLAGGAFLASGLIEGFKSFYDAAAESAKIGALTQAAITSTGGAANVTAAQVSSLATSISNKTGVDDEAIQSGANLLLTFTNVRNEAGKGNDIFDQTTSIMTDMAAVLGTDASGSAIQLGKALNDPIKGVSALTKVGVSFTDQQKDQIKTLVESGDTLGAQKVILAELSKEFGGAAAAASTPLDKLKVNLGNIQEAIGGALIPVVSKFASFVVDTLIPGISDLWSGFSKGTDSIDSVQTRFAVVGAVIRGIVFDRIVPAVKEIQSSIAEFVSSDSFQRWLAIAQQGGAVLLSALQGLGSFMVGTLIPAVASFGGFLAQYQGYLIPLAGFIGGVALAWGAYTVATTIATTVTGIFTAAQAALDVVLDANPIGLVVLAIAGLVGAFVVAYQNSETFRQIVSAAWSGIQVAASTAWAIVKPLFDLWVFEAQLIGQAFMFLVGVISSAWSAISGVISGVIGNIVNIVQGFGNLIIGIFTGDFGRAKDGAVQALGGLIGYITTIPRLILGALGNLGGLLLSAGADLIMGLAKGIGNAAGAVVQAAKNVASSVVSGVKGLLGIHSPSTVFAELGGFVGQGFANGIVSMQPVVASAMSQMANSSALDSLLGGKNMVKFGDVSDSTWQQLLDSGWKGDPTDGMEALYRPSADTSASSGGTYLQLDGPAVTALLRGEMVQVVSSMTRTARGRGV